MVFQGIEKGQAAIEALLALAIMLAVLSMILCALLSERQSIEERIFDVGRINDAEASARALEALYSSGRSMRFGFEEEGISYRIQGDRMLVDLDSSTIEIGGVFGGKKNG